MKLSLARAAAPKNHKQGGLNRKSVWPLGSGGHESDVKGLAGGGGGGASS